MFAGVSQDLGIPKVTGPPLAAVFVFVDTCKTRGRSNRYRVILTRLRKPVFWRIAGVRGHSIFPFCVKFFLWPNTTRMGGALPRHVGADDSTRSSDTAQRPECSCSRMSCRIPCQFPDLDTTAAPSYSISTQPNSFSAMILWAPLGLIECSEERSLEHFRILSVKKLFRSLVNEEQMTVIDRHEAAA